MSTKKIYSHKPILAGRDSSLVMLTLFLDKGSSIETIAPGTFLVAIIKEVLSLPDGATSWSANTKKRVVFFGSSSILFANAAISKSSAARRLAIEATPCSTEAKRVASALLTTAWRSACGKCLFNHSWHCAKDCECE